MTLDTLFTLCNLAVLPAWLLLVFAPGSPWTARVVHSLLVPCVLGTVYVLTFALAPAPPEGGSFSTLPGVMALFTSPHVALAGWVHYLVFDLFVGAWEVRDAERLGIRHVVVVPCLLLTFLLGPSGLLAWMGVRWGMRGAVGLREQTA
jgi:hypothetical protein